MTDTFISTRMPKKNTNDRITVEALKYYVPFFQKGDAAAEKLLNDYDSLSPSEINHLETVARLKDLAVDKIAALAGPLITRELNKVIKGSHLNGREDLFDIIYYAGINGMIKGLRHFDVDKMNKSSTNYLFQWIVTYAKKELSVLEAPFGIAPSRFQRYKKISAVRKKLSEKIGRYATNEEVLEYFVTGQADLKTMNGRLEKDDKPYAVNKNMTIDIIEEQENFELNLNHTNLLDPLEDYSADVKLSEKAETIFSETVMGVFVASYNFTEEAVAVLMSDLKVDISSEELRKALNNLTDTEYKALSARWKDLLRDINGPFYTFLKNYDNVDSSGFDVVETMRNIEEYSKAIKPARYAILFKGKKVENND